MFRSVELKKLGKYPIKNPQQKPCAVVAGLRLDFKKEAQNIQKPQRSVMEWCSGEHK